ncbi:MAG: glycosyltransferase [Flavobacteriaceae bacterium]|nr:glycosyltransferase [Flavobacteriaceae bacterium]
MSDRLIIIFTRNPELGKVKTRLAKSIGDAAALNIYNYLLDHTEKTISQIEGDKAVYYSEKVRHEDIWKNSRYQKYVQQGNDLGLKMQNAFQSAFNNGYKKVIILGSDLPDLNPDHIRLATKKLDQYDVVIGPAQDGGYYLLALKSLPSSIFKNKAWGTSSVLKDTLNDLQSHSVFLLEELNDTDTFEDIRDNDKLKAFISSND